MPRIPEVDPDAAAPRVKVVLDAQVARFGAPLKNHLLYAHSESVFKGVRGMWAALEGAGQLEAGLSALVNRRVAASVGCVF